MNFTQFVVFALFIMLGLIVLSTLYEENEKRKNNKKK